MGFSTNRSQSIDLNLEETKQKADLKEELSSLGLAIEEAEAKLKEYTTTKDEIEAVKSILASLNEEVVRKTEEKNKLDEILAQSGEIKATLDKTKSELVIADEELSIVIKQKEDTTKEIEALKESGYNLVRSLDEERAEKDKLLEQLKENLNSKHKDLEVLQKNIPELESQIDLLLNDRKDAQEKLETVSSELALKNGQLAFAQDALRLLEDAHIQKTKELKEREEKEIERLDKELEDLKQRNAEYEGGLSVKEKHLDKMAISLSKAKARLEEINGRQFPDIII